jgi:hypothetical protein
MSQIIAAKDLNVQNVTATRPKLNKGKRLNSILLYSENDSANKTPLYLETPEAIISQFGLSKYEKGNTGTFDYSLPLTARSAMNEESETVEHFFAQLKQLDEFMIQFGIKYSKEIFKKEYTEEQRGIVEAMYKPCVRQKNDQDGNPYPPNISPKIPKVWEENASGDGKPNVEVYLGSKAPIQINGWDDLSNMIQKRTPVTVIMQPRIWFVSGRYGVTLRITHIKVMAVSKSGPPRGYAFSKEPSKIQDNQTESSEEKVQSTEEKEESDEVEEEDDEEIIEDSDDESEEIEEVEEN